MALIQYDATTERGGKSLLDTLRGYFVRYRLALYLLSGAAVALGVAFNWNWLTAAGLLPFVGISTVYADDVNVHETRDSPGQMKKLRRRTRRCRLGANIVRSATIAVAAAAS